MSLAVRVGAGNPEEFSEFTEHPFAHPCSFLLCFIKNAHDKISQGKGRDWNFLSPKKGSVTAVVRAQPRVL